jgi:hypothetical protein
MQAIVVDNGYQYYYNLTRPVLCCLNKGNTREITKEVFAPRGIIGLSPTRHLIRTLGFIGLWFLFADFERLP